METENLGMSNQEELQSPANDVTPNAAEMTGSLENAENSQSKKYRHNDHAVSRKYRMFSNHSSANDIPHTNTSF